MEKIYQNPEVKIVKLQTAHHMLQVSDPRYGGNTELTNGNLSRGADYWDDEEEDY